MYIVNVINIQKHSLYKSIDQKHGAFKFSLHQKFKADFDFRNSCSEVFCKKGILEHLADFTGKHSQFLHNSYYTEAMLSTAF